MDVDLLNEHLARYAFAARLARGKRVLDAGCGAGYGSAELARTAHSVIGIDVAPEAVDSRAPHYPLPTCTSSRRSCTALPHGDASFDLVVAFEVIEHLPDWRDFLLEVRRVLAPDGQFIVSTPNKLYYTESRGPQGANPFHVHEFDFDEFRAELQRRLPARLLFLENHVEGVTFQPHEAGPHRGSAGGCRRAGARRIALLRGGLRASAADRQSDLRLRAARRQRAARARAPHRPAGAGARRQGRLAGKAQQDLAEFDREHQKLLDMFREQKAELERSNRWAEELEPRD